MEAPKQQLSESLALSYATVAARAGFTHLRIARYADAVQLFSFALEFDMNQQKSEWPQPAQSLDKLYGLAIAHQMSGNHSKSLEILKNIRPLAEKHFGEQSAKKTLEISSRLKAVADRLETNQQHHKSGLLAITAPGGKLRISTDPERSTNFGTPVPNANGSSSLFPADLVLPLSEPSHTDEGPSTESPTRKSRRSFGGMISRVFSARESSKRIIHPEYRVRRSDLWEDVEVYSRANQTPYSPRSSWRRRIETSEANAARRPRTFDYIPLRDRVIALAGGIIYDTISSSHASTVLDVTPQTGPVELPNNAAPRSDGYQDKAFGYSGETSQNAGISSASLLNIRDEITRELATGSYASPKGKRVANKEGITFTLSNWTGLPLFYQDLLFSCLTGD
jgi:hypothetical protein